MSYIKGMKWYKIILKNWCLKKFHLRPSDFVYGLDILPIWFYKFSERKKQYGKTLFPSETNDIGGNMFLGMVYLITVK